MHTRARVRGLPRAAYLGAVREGESAGGQHVDFGGSERINVLTNLRR